jgi:CRISPR-associated protein Csd1
MIRELSELGKKIRSEQAGQKQIHNALKDEPYTIDLVLNADGSFVQFAVIEKRMSQAEAITAKKGKARLLLDKASEVLSYPTEKSEKKHALFMDKLNDFKNIPAIKPVMNFYFDNRSNGFEKALNNFEAEVPEKERGGNIAFRLKTSDGNRIHEEPGVYKAIIEKYEKTEKLKLSVSSKICSVCGTNKYPVEDTPHGMIKRVPDGQTAGCALVSYNETAFESYALSGNENSSICKNCATTYVEGLNWLLSTGSRKTNEKGKEYTDYTHRKKFGDDTAVVFWTRENQSLKEIDILERPTEADVAGLFNSISAGDCRPHDNIEKETDLFYSCTLSGAAARIAIRDWLERSLPDFRIAIAQWFKDIAIIEYRYDLKKHQIHYSRLYDLAKSCQNEKENKQTILSRVACSLWNAALKNSAIPIWILTAVLKRIHLDGKGVTPDRAALIRLILNRNNKGGRMVQEKLDPENGGIAYNSGRIFAVLESVQRAALGKNINAGVRERFFSSASTTPASAFGRLLKNAQNHLSKLKGEKPGLAIVLDKELTGIIATIKTLPPIFSLEEQGQFAIGYYHQKNHQFNKPELKEITESEEV